MLFASPTYVIFDTIMPPPRAERPICFRRAAARLMPSLLMPLSALRQIIVFVIFAAPARRPRPYVCRATLRVCAES